MNLPVFSARYCRMAPDSNRAMRVPPGPSWSTMAGIRLFGESARKPGANCSPLLMSTATTS